MIGLPCNEKNCDNMLSRFDRIPESDRQTDRRTDRIVISISRMLTLADAR